MKRASKALGHPDANRRGLLVVTVALITTAGCSYQGNPDDDNESDHPGSPVRELPCLTCHSRPMGDRRAVVDAEGAGGHTLSDAPLTNPECYVCHEITQHQLGRVRLWRNPYHRDSIVVLEGAPSSDPTEGAKLVPLCGTCHSDSDYAMHMVEGKWQPTCLACHDLHDPDDANLALVPRRVHNLTLGEHQPVAFTSRTGAGSFDDGDPAANDGVCQVCHTATRFHQHGGESAAHHEGEDCTTCHTHQDGFQPTAAGSCMACHSLPQGDRPAIVNADGSGGHHLTGGKLTDGACVVCHDMTEHQQGDVRLWDNPANPSAALVVTGDPDDLVTFCTSCHGGSDHPTVHKTGATWEPACTECHELHDPLNLNLSLVTDVVHSQTLDTDKSIVFTARTGPHSFSNGAGATDGVCQVCHTETTYHLHDGTGAPHHDGEDCTDCHSHGEGFMPAGGGSCVACHSATQGGRRAVVGEFVLTSRHVQGGGVTDADCAVCHDMSRHQQGQVRLKDADDPDNPAAVVGLRGNPMSDPAEAGLLGPFCLACHDGDGAGGTPPFADGMMPRPINAGAWAAASHRVGQITCVGDGETFGCHGSGHGSTKVKLLAPWDGTQAGNFGKSLG